jgi:nucleoid DNA-binding protein
MFHLLYKYFVLYDYVNIPGVGHFSVERHPAKIDVDNNIIHAPESTIKYKNETDVADKGVYTFIAKELDIDVVDANRQFQDFSHQLKNSIVSRKVVELPSFGTLKMVKNEIEFQPVPFVKDYYPPVSIDKTSLSYVNDVVVDEDQSLEDEKDLEDKPAKGLWWLYALLLGLIAVGAIVYYYYYYEAD